MRPSIARVALSYCLPTLRTEAGAQNARWRSGPLPDEKSWDELVADFRDQSVAPIPPPQPPQVTEVKGQLELNTRIHPNGLVDIHLNNVEPAHITALFRGEFAASVDRVVTEQAQAIARAKADGSLPVDEE